MSEQVKKLIPKLRFPEFKSSEFGALKKIEEISDQVTAGGTPSTTEKSYWGGDIRWMSSGELNLKKVYEVQGRITELGLRNSSTKIIPKNSVLIGLAGQGKTRGTIAMNMVELCINQSISAIYPNPSKYSSDYLYHNLDNRYDELRSLSTGGEGRGGLNLQIIKSLNIPLPEIKEQQKIADCLSSLDDLITAQNQKVEALKQHKKGLMQQLFPAEGETVPKLRFPEFKNDSEWREKPFNEIFSRVTSKNHENNLNVLTISAQMGLVSQLEYFNKSVSAKDVSGYYLLHKGDFAYNKSYSQGYPVGAIKLLNNYDKGVVSTLYICFRAKDVSDNLFFEQYFDAGLLNSQIEAIAQEGARNHGLLNLSVVDFFELTKLYLPSSDERKKIASFLTSIDELINIEIDVLDALKEHKKGLMQQLFPALEESTL